MKLKVSTGHYHGLNLTEIFEDEIRQYRAAGHEVRPDSRDYKLIELVKYLEMNVDYACQWVTTSLWSGGFYITESDTWWHWNARVVVGRGPELYRISYRIPPGSEQPERGTLEVSDWDKEWWVKFETTSVEEAAGCILLGLERAERFLPKDPTEMREWIKIRRPDRHH